MSDAERDILKNQSWSQLARNYLVYQRNIGMTEVLMPRKKRNIETLEDIRKDLGDCTRCPLHEGRLNIVFGEGNPSAGLMFVGDDPFVIEYNVRFGDPECQVILTRLKSDLLDIIVGVINRNLSSITPVWTADTSVSVGIASGGYPGNYKTGLPISGLDKVDQDVIVFHAGTKTGNQQGEVLTNGGRVLSVTATGKSIEDARNKIYSNISKIHFEGMQYRKDIAKF